MKKVKKTMNGEIIFDIKVLDRVNDIYEKKLEKWYITSMKELEKWYKTMKKRHN